MMREKWIAHLLGALAAVMLSGGSAIAADQPVSPTTPAQETRDERALKLLQSMSDTLGKARTVSFKARSLVPVPAPTGQYISLFASSRVVMQRPDRLFVETRNDLAANDFYYDGKTVTAVGPDRKYHARQVAPGSTVDAILEGEHPGSDTLAPFVDLLVADPYARLTNDLTTALLVGQSTIDGVPTDHLAFTGKGVDWEIWIGAEDRLPRLLVVAYRSGERQPTFIVEFSGWKLDAAVPAGVFTATIPKDAVKLEFRLQGPQQSR